MDDPTYPPMAGVILLEIHNPQFCCCNLSVVMVYCYVTLAFIDMNSLHSVLLFQPCFVE